MLYRVIVVKEGRNSGAVLAAKGARKSHKGKQVSGDSTPKPCPKVKYLPLIFHQRRRMMRLTFESFTLNDEILLAIERSLLRIPRSYTMH